LQIPLKNIGERRMTSSQKAMQDLEFARLSTTLESSPVLFRIAPDDRNDDENEAIVSLLSEVPYLKEISQTAERPNEFLLEMSKLFQYETYSRGQAIGHYGDNPRKFWVILKGDVRLYIPRFSDEEDLSPVSDDMSPILSRYGESTKGSLFHLDSPLLGSISPMSQSNARLFEKKSTLFFELPSGCSSPLRRPSDASSPTFDGKKAFGRQVTKQVFLDFGGSVIEEESKEMSRVGIRARRQTKSTASVSMISPKMEEFSIFKRFNMNKKYFNSEDVLKFQFERSMNCGGCFADLETDPYLPLPMTLVAWEEVHVISMPMKHYTKQLRKLNRILTENLNILEDLFPEIPERVLLPLATKLEKKTFHKGDVIYREGSECTDLYIIQKGEVDLIKDVEHETPQSQEASPKLKFKSKKEKRKILMLSDRQMFGEESVLDSEVNMFTAKVRSLEMTSYILSKYLVEKTASKYEHFLPAITQKAMTSFKLKCMRESELTKETKVVSKILEKPTKQERNDKQYVKNALDYYTRLLLQERSPKGNVSSSHIRSGGRESPIKLSQEHSQELQKLADLKTKMGRNKVKIDPRFELEESSPTFKAKRREADENILKSVANKPSYSQFEGQMPTSLWNRGLEGTMFLKRVKALHLSRKSQNNKSMKASHEYSPNRSSSPSIPFALKRKATETQFQRVMNIESLVTSEQVEEEMPLAKSIISEGVEKAIKKEIDDMISSKLSDNKKDTCMIKSTSKVKPDKVKRGFACLQSSEKYEKEKGLQLNQLRYLDTTESDDKSFVPLGNSWKFSLNSPKNDIAGGLSENVERNGKNKKEKLPFKGLKESNRRSMPALAEYFKGSVYHEDTEKKFEEGTISLKKMNSVAIAGQRQRNSSTFKEFSYAMLAEVSGQEEVKNKNSALPTILSTNMLRKVKSRSPVATRKSIHS